MGEHRQVKWLPEPADDNYGSAEAYLSLQYKPKQARKWAGRLREAPMTQYAAKDILRASSISIMAVQAFDWSRQQHQIAEGTPLSPILLVRQGKGRPLIIADGFHRLCALFAEDEQLQVPCKIV
ncbi:MAG: hypothetical protein ACLGI6_04075 [Gammaproteobacteria bacterium]